MNTKLYIYEVRERTKSSVTTLVIAVHAPSWTRADELVTRHIKTEKYKNPSTPTVILTAHISSNVPESVQVISESSPELTKEERDSLSDDDE